MKCKRFEKMIIASVDGRLDERSKALLEEHLRTCPACRSLAAQYESLAGILRSSNLEEEPPARFWESLRPRLREEEKVAPFIFFDRLGLRAIPAFLAVAVVAASLFLLSPAKSELTNSEKLLLGNDNPITEARIIFEEQKPESRNMMLIFANLEGIQSSRRPRP